MRQLNSLPSEFLINEGRVYGGGMYKLEPKEMAKINADSLLTKLIIEISTTKQKLLF